jgi:hypothetical protein
MEEFAKELEILLQEACDALESAHLSEDFLRAVDQSIGEIPNLVGAHSSSEENVNSSNPT